MTKIADQKRDRSLARLLELEPSIRKLAHSYAGRMAEVGPYSADDLAQEIYCKALVELDRGFSPKWSFKSYVLRMARNHLISMARTGLARKRRGILPTSLEEETLQSQTVLAFETDPGKRVDLRNGIRDLLRWLRENRAIYPWGWELVQFMLLTHGDVNYTALALTVRTDQAWTVGMVRSTVKQITRTQKGGALCSALGVPQEA